MNSYYVYTIKENDIIIYVGSTNNISRRQKEHNRDLNKAFNIYNDYLIVKHSYIDFKHYLKQNKIKVKYLYQKVVENNPNEFKMNLEVIKEFTIKQDCLLYEAYIILGYYFTTKQLYQSKVASIKYF